MCAHNVLKIIRKHSCEFNDLSYDDLWDNGLSKGGGVIKQMHEIQNKTMYYISI